MMSGCKKSVSIVITVYNRETTLCKCIDSALSQMMKEIELVIVDDGSTDNSVKIIEEYVKEYPNIQFIQNEHNKGAGYAKNRGVQAASGEFIIFLDSDDYLGEDYIEHLYQALIKTKADIAVADLALVEKDVATVAPIPKCNMVCTLFELADIPLDKPSLISGLIVAAHWGGASACTKLARKEYWLEHPFDEGRRCDDLPAVLPMLASAARIVYVPGHPYYYVQHSASVEREQVLEKDIAAIQAIVKTLDKYEKIGAPVEYGQVLVAMSLFSVLHTFLIKEEVIESQLYIDQMFAVLDRPRCSALLSEAKNPFWSIVKEQNIYPSQRLVFSLLQQIAAGKKTEVLNRILAWHEQKESAQPKVSIVIPVYNGANYMRDAIDSALAQTYQNIEIIVVNDGSCDDGETEKVALSYGDRIRYYWKKNGGVATALNFGISKMTGEYFSWLSHDDMYTPDKIEMEVQWLAAQPDSTTIIVEGYQVVNASGQYMYTVNLHHQYPAHQLEKPLFAVLRGGVNGCALLIHKSHFERVGLFAPELPTTQDYDLWFRMFRGQKIYYAATSNVLSRSHEEQGSRALLATHVIECDKLWIGMMQELTEQEKIEISGSTYLFYQELWTFLSSVTGYTGAIAYARRRMLDETLLEYERGGNGKLLQTVANECEVTTTYLRNHILPHRTVPAGKKRVFFQLIDRNVGGGLNKIVVQTANQLSADYDVMIGTWTVPFSDGYASCAAVTELCLDYPVPQQQGHYADLLALLGIDVFVYSYCCAPEHLPLLNCLGSAGVKTVAWSHEDYFLPYWRQTLWASLPVRERCLPEADAVVWLNQSSLSVYAVRHNNGICIPNPLTIAHKSEKRIRHRKNLLAIGRFDDDLKGLSDVLLVFSQVLKEHPEAELFVVGAYDLKLPVRTSPKITCEQLIERERIPSEQLHLIGWTEEIDRYYELCSIHIMPSLYEGFGLVVLEAAAHGVPSVVFGGSGMDDIITDGVDGVIVDRGDWRAMAQRISTLLCEPAALASMARELIDMCARYDPERIRCLWTGLIEAITTTEAGVLKQYLGVRQPQELSNKDAFNAIREYERVILEMLSAKAGDISMPQNAYLSTASEWERECYLMQQSTSWKITWPLRAVKKVIRSLKVAGFRQTLKKIKGYLTQKKGGE